MLVKSVVALALFASGCNTTARQGDSALESHSVSAVKVEGKVLEVHSHLADSQAACILLLDVKGAREIAFSRNQGDCRGMTPDTDIVLAPVKRMTSQQTLILQDETYNDNIANYHEITSLVTGKIIEMHKAFSDGEAACIVVIDDNGDRLVVHSSNPSRCDGLTPNQNARIALVNPMPLADTAMFMDESFNNSVWGYYTWL